MADTHTLLVEDVENLSPRQEWVTSMECTLGGHAQVFVRDRENNRRQVLPDPSNPLGFFLGRVRTP